MIEDDAGTVRKVEWNELCPWLILFRCFRMAIGSRMLILATMGATITAGGWAVILLGFSRDPGIEAPPANPWSALTDLVPNAPDFAGGTTRILDSDFDPTTVVDRSAEPFLGTWRQLSLSFKQVFDFSVVSGDGVTNESEITDDSLRSSRTVRLACSLTCGLWGLLVWAFFGGAITRSAAVELACEERIGFGQMIGYARARWRSYVGAPLVPLVLALFIACMISIPGLLLWFNLTGVLAAIVWPLLLVGGALMTLLLMGLFFGWPLMFAATSVDGADALDAVSHSYAYTFQRPWRYLFYAAVAVVLGTLGWLVVSNVAAATVGLTYWAASLMVGTEKIGKVIVDGGLISFWCGCVKLLAVGFLYSYFWTASTAIYLLLRLDNDNKEMDEIFLDDEEDPPSALPPLTTNEAGVPVPADEADSDGEE